MAFIFNFMVSTTFTKEIEITPYHNWNYLKHYSTCAYQAANEVLLFQWIYVILNSFGLYDTVCVGKGALWTIAVSSHRDWAQAPGCKRLCSGCNCTGAWVYSHNPDRLDGGRTLARRLVLYCLSPTTVSSYCNLSQNKLLHITGTVNCEKEWGWLKMQQIFPQGKSSSPTHSQGYTCLKGRAPASGFHRFSYFSSIF